MSSKTPARNDGFLQGKFLIALPGMPDARFERTVILMCAHSDDGAMGIIINKAITGMPFGQLMDKLGIAVTAKRTDTPVLFGGPVETQQGLILHSSEYAAPNSTQVIADVSLTGTIDVLRAIAEGRGPQKAVFALGYAGWESGQIESELHGNGWVHCDADTAILFDMPLQARWSAALGKLGINISGLSAEAGRA